MNVKFSLRDQKRILDQAVNMYISAVKLGILRDGGEWRLTRFWSKPQVATWRTAVFGTSMFT